MTFAEEEVDPTTPTPATAVRGSYVADGYVPAPVVKKVIPVKKVVEYVRPQPVISYAPPVPVKSVEPLLTETKYIGHGPSYGSYGSYGPFGATRDILPAPVIPLGELCHSEVIIRFYNILNFAQAVSNVLKFQYHGNRSWKLLQ